MTEEKSTPKRAPAAKKTVAGAAPTASTASKAPAVKKATPVAAEKKTPARKDAQTQNAEIALQPPPTAAAETAAAPVITAAAAAPSETLTPDPTPAPAKPSAEERYRMVQSAAYFIAEREGFQGCDSHYWALAEQEIAAQLGETAA